MKKGVWKYSDSWARTTQKAAAHSSLITLCGRELKRVQRAGWHVHDIPACITYWQLTANAGTTVGKGALAGPTTDGHGDVAHLDIGCVDRLHTRNDGACDDGMDARNSLDGIGAEGVIRIHDSEKAAILGEVTMNKPCS